MIWVWLSVNQTFVRVQSTSEIKFVDGARWEEEAAAAAEGYKNGNCPFTQRINLITETGFFRCIWYLRNISSMFSDFSCFVNDMLRHGPRLESIYLYIWWHQNRHSYENSGEHHLSHATTFISQSKYVGDENLAVNLDGGCVSTEYIALFSNLNFFFFKFIFA